MSPTLTDTALDVQGELFTYACSAPGARYAAAEMRLAARQMHLRTVEPFTTIDDVAERDGPRTYRDLLRTATTFAVSTDICTVLKHAAETITPYTLHTSDLPALNGFVWLETPLVVRDDTPERKPIVVRAFGWRSLTDHSGKTGALLLHWTDPTDPLDHASADLTFTAEYGVEVGASHVYPPRGLWALIAGMWVYGEAPPRINDDLEVGEAFRLLLSFLRFIDEPWLGDQLSRPSRPSGRRAARVGLEPSVRVIHLRKRPAASTGEHTGTGTPWSVRVLVGAASGGFWRNQWYPSKGVHRQRWIFPYEAGDPDAPLRIPDAVYRVDR